VYEKRVGDLDREMIPTSNLILGHMSRPRQPSRGWAEAAAASSVGDNLVSIL
jgi:hypothetical protein